MKKPLLVAIFALFSLPGNFFGQEMPPEAIVVSANYTVDIVKEGGDLFIDQTIDAGNATWYWNKQINGAAQPLMALDADGRLAFFRADDPLTPIIIIDPTGAAPSICIGGKRVLLEETSAGIDVTGGITKLPTGGIDFSESTGGGMMLNSPAPLAGAYAAGNGTASANYATAVGHWTQATGEFALALGCDNRAQASGATAIGYYAIASGTGTISFGVSSSASNTCSIAVGHSAVAPGEYAVAVGSSSVASGFVSTAYGRLATASGSHSNAIGSFSKAEGGSYGSALGAGAYAKGNNTTALGVNANAMESCALAVGNGAVASGNYSTAVGSGAKAPAQHAISIGSNAIALGDYAYVVGAYSTGEANLASAFGHDAHARASQSTAIGPWANARAANTIALGTHADASYEQQIALGSFNKVEPTGILFMLGNGTATTNRSNALTVTKGGKTTVLHKNYITPTGSNPTPTQPEAFEVRGASTFRGRVILAEPAGDISMGGFTTAP